MKIIQTFIWLYVVITFYAKNYKSKLKLDKFGIIFCNSKNNRGAIVVEYVLLLVGCVAIALIVNKFIEIDNIFDNSGWLIKVWWKAIEVIAEDM